MSTKSIFILSIIIFTSLLFAIPHSFISIELGNTIVTVSAFLFGIIAGFYIMVTTTDYNNLKNLLAIETAKLISLYQNIQIYEPNNVKKLSQLIDIYIRRNFDFEIIDYAKCTNKEFEAITGLVRKMSNTDSTIYQGIQNIMNEIISGRQQLLVLGVRTLSLFQWIILIILASIFIVSLYGMRSNDVFFNIITVTISSSSVLVLLMIRDLDFYIWNEKTFGYDIFENVFQSIGQLPYYPMESIKSGRITPHEKTYRIGIHVQSSQNERTLEIHSQEYI